MDPRIDHNCESLPLSDARRVDALCDEFEALWRQGQRPQMTVFLLRAGKLDLPALSRELVLLDLHYRRVAGEQPTGDDYREPLAALDPLWLNEAVALAVQGTLPLAGPGTPRSQESALPSNDTERSEKDAPQRIGLYKVRRLLGQGGFGRVWLALDEELCRDVAIKLPHRRSAQFNAADFLAEARVLASLDHPGIVPVYDVGHTDDGRNYVVSKFIRGSDLARRLRVVRYAPDAAAELVAAVAEALHHAHQRGLVHRDIKPANILIEGVEDETTSGAANGDRSVGRPVVADFGLALKDADFDAGPEYAGTPAYMSPEQARGESHRVDRRSDIFSLGVVLYELLAGQRLFQGSDPNAVFVQITTQEVQSPRALAPTTPRELERICLRALSKRASDRYGAAIELAEDLRSFLKARNLAETLLAAVQGAVSPKALGNAAAAGAIGDGSTILRERFGGRFGNTQGAAVV